jgi:hypothetical protein
MKGLARRNTHEKYENPTTYQSKVMTKVKVFEKKVKLQGQSHGIKWKVLPEGIHASPWSTMVFLGVAISHVTLQNM